MLTAKQKKAIKRFPTVAEIARSQGLSTHHVEYVVRAHNIKPAAIAGNVRVFDQRAIMQIINERQDIEGRMKTSTRIVHQNKVWINMLINWQG